MINFGTSSLIGRLTRKCLARDLAPFRNTVSDFGVCKKSAKNFWQALLAALLCGWAHSLNLSRSRRVPLHSVTLEIC